MQFAGKIGILIFVLLISIAFVVVFGSGLLVGRQFPAHHYERYGNSNYLLDSTTGRVCKPITGSETKALSFDEVYGHPNPLAGDTNPNPDPDPPACNK